MIWRILDKWYKIICFLTWFLAGTMSLLIGFQILNRFLIQTPAPWTEEFCRYNFVWLTIIASAKAIHDKEQLAVDIMPYLLANKPRIKNTMRLIAELLLLFFLGVMFKQTVAFCQKSVGTSCLTIRFPVLYVYLVLPVGFMSMFLFEVKNMVETLRKLTK